MPTQLDAAAAPHRPEGHQPVAPAWTALPAAPMVLAQLAVQSAPDDPAGAAAFAQLTALLDGVRHDVVESDDQEGARNHIALAYWDDLDAHDAWAAWSAVRAWWEDGEVGRWREVATVAPERIETLHSDGALAPTQGSAQLSLIAPTDVHEYPGAMRDRMAISRTDALTHDVCFIRTAQDWTGCGPAERARYLEHVEPTLCRGADYLACEPEESGCLSARFAREPGKDRSCVLAWFRSLADLERWTHSHPTHLAILSEFFALVEQGGGQIELALWHEVFTLPAGAARLEYRDCHPRTGFLHHFDEERS
jgi:phenylacetaldoxime dehydratase/aldoxime dehydratase